MRYYTEFPGINVPIFGECYCCDHPVYCSCTLFLINHKGLAVIQQRQDNLKRTYWNEIDPWLANAVFMNPRFKEYFDKNAESCKDGLYPTVTIRQLMWALRMKPLKREQWETVFDRRKI